MMRLLLLSLSLCLLLGPSVTAAPRFQRIFVPEQQPETWPTDGEAYVPVPASTLLELLAAEKNDLGANEGRLRSLWAYGRLGSNGATLNGEVRLELVGRDLGPWFLPWSGSHKATSATVTSQPVWKQLDWVPFRAGSTKPEPRWGLWGDSLESPADDQLAASRIGIRFSEAGSLRLGYQLLGEALSESSYQFCLESPDSLNRRWIIDLPISQTLRTSGAIISKYRSGLPDIDTNGGIGSDTGSEENLPSLNEGYQRWVVTPRPGALLSVIVEAASSDSTKPAMFMASEKSHVVIVGTQAETTTNLRLTPLETPSERFTFQLPELSELISVDVNGTAAEVVQSLEKQIVVPLPRQRLADVYRVKVTYWSPIDTLDRWRVPRVDWQSTLWAEGELAVTIDRPLRLIDVPEQQNATLVANSLTQQKHRQLYRLSANNCEIDLALTTAPADRRIEIDRHIRWTDNELRSQVTLRSERAEQSLLVDRWKLPVKPGWKVIDVRCGDKQESLDWRLVPGEDLDSPGSHLVIEPPVDAALQTARTVVLEVVRLVAEEQIEVAQLAAFDYQNAMPLKETIYLDADDAWQLDLFAAKRQIMRSVTAADSGDSAAAPPLFRSGEQTDLAVDGEAVPGEVDGTIAANPRPSSALTNLLFDLTKLQRAYSLSELMVRRRSQNSEPQVSMEVSVAPPADRAKSSTTDYRAIFKLSVPTEVQQVTVLFSHPLPENAAWIDRQSGEPQKANLIQSKSRETISVAGSQAWQIELPSREDREIEIVVKAVLATSDAMPIPLPAIQQMAASVDEGTSIEATNLVEQTARVTVSPWPANYWRPTHDALTPLTKTTLRDVKTDTLCYSYRPTELRQSLLRTAKQSLSELPPRLVMQRRPAGASLSPLARLMSVDTICMPTGELHHHAQFEIVDDSHEWLSWQLPPNSRDISTRDSLAVSSNPPLIGQDNEVRIPLSQLAEAKQPNQVTISYSTGYTSTEKSLSRPLVDGTQVQAPVVDTKWCTTPWAWRVYTPQEFSDARGSDQEHQTPRLWRHRLFGSLADGNPRTAFNPVDRESWLRSLRLWSNWLNLSPTKLPPNFSKTEGVSPTLQGWRMTERLVSSGIPEPIRLVSTTRRQVLLRLATMLAMTLGVFLLTRRPYWYGWIAAVLLVGVLVASGGYWRLAQSLWIGWWLAIPGWFLWEQLGRWSGSSKDRRVAFMASWGATYGTSDKKRSGLLLLVSFGLASVGSLVLADEPPREVEKIFLPQASRAIDLPEDQETPPAQESENAELPTAVPAKADREAREEKWYVRDGFLSALLRRQQPAAVGGDWVLSSAEYEGELIDEAETGLVRPGSFVARYKLETFRANTNVWLPLDDEQARWNKVAMLDGVPLVLNRQDSGRLLMIDRPGIYDLVIRFDPVTTSNLTEAQVAVRVPSVLRSKLSVRLPASFSNNTFRDDTLRLGPGLFLQERQERLLTASGSRLSEIKMSWPSQRAAPEREASYDELQWITVTPKEVLLDVQWLFVGKTFPNEVSLEIPAWLERIDQKQEPKRLTLKRHSTAERDTTAEAAGDASEFVATARYRYRRESAVGVLPLGSISVGGGQARSRMIGFSVDSALTWDKQSNGLRERGTDLENAGSGPRSTQESIDREQFLDRWNRLASKSRTATPDQALLLLEGNRTPTLSIQPRVQSSPAIDNLSLVVHKHQIEAQLSIPIARETVRAFQVDAGLKIDSVVLKSVQGEQPLAWTRPTKQRLVVLLDEPATAVSRLIIRGTNPRHSAQVHASSERDDPKVPSILSDPQMIRSTGSEGSYRLSVYRSDEVLVEFVGEVGKTAAPSLNGRSDIYAVGTVLVQEGSELKLNVSLNRTRLQVDSVTAIREEADQVRIDVHIEVKVMSGRAGSFFLTAPQFAGLSLDLLAPQQAELRSVDPTRGTWEVVVRKTDRSILDPPLALHLTTKVPATRFETNPFQVPVIEIENSQPGDAWLATAIPLFEEQRWRVELAEKMPPITAGVDDEVTYSLAAEQATLMAPLSENGPWQIYRGLSTEPMQVSLSNRRRNEGLPRLLFQDTRVTVDDLGGVATLCQFGIDAADSAYCLIEVGSSQKLQAALIEGRQAVMVQRSPTVWKCELASINRPQVLSVIVSSEEQSLSNHTAPWLLSEKGTPLSPEQSLLTVRSSDHWEVKPEEEFYAMTQGEYELERLGQLVKLSQAYLMRMSSERQAALPRLWQERLREASKQASRRWETAELRSMLEPLAGGIDIDSLLVTADTVTSVGGTPSIESRLLSTPSIGQAGYYASAGPLNVHLQIAPVVTAMPSGLESLLALSLAGLMLAASCFISWESPGDWFGSFRNLVLVLLAIAWWLFMQPSGVGLLLALLILIAQARELVAKVSTRFQPTVAQ